MKELKYRLIQTITSSLSFKMNGNPLKVEKILVFNINKLISEEFIDSNYFFEGEAQIDIKEKSLIISKRYRISGYIKMNRNKKVEIKSPISIHEITSL